MLLPFCNEALANASGTPQDHPSPPPDSDADERRRRCESLLHLAQVKLVSQSDLQRGRQKFCQAAQTAVLDARILLPFDRSSPAACRLQLELVASHMRTVYSFPEHRECVRSGYSSEPILAEAAARQLNTWRTIGDRSWGFPAEPALLILGDSVDYGLLAPDEIHKAVGRLLLTLARDRANVTTFPETLPRIFSRAVPVNAFIGALYPPAIAQQVLDSKPDNLPSGWRASASDNPEPDGRTAATVSVTFGEAFKNAVLNFTHFSEWEGESVPDERAALRCFVRSTAVVCQRKNDVGVDAFIPVLLTGRDESESKSEFESAPRLSTQAMTALLVRFTRRQGPRSAYPIDEREAELFDRDGRTTTTGTLRPYVTLVMALEESGPPPSHAGAPGVGGVPALPTSTPTPVVVGRLPARASDRASDEDEGETVPHPRYSITAYGCSCGVYQVVGSEEESSVYAHILRQGDPLREHPRQDARSRDLVRRMQPEFSAASLGLYMIMAPDDRLPESADAQPEPLSEESDEDED